MSFVASTRGEIARSPPAKWSCRIGASPGTSARAGAACEGGDDRGGEGKDPDDHAITPHM